MSEVVDDRRTIGLWSATGVGVGAIVGGGILVLAGTALAAAGPSAVIAFALNGGVAFLTAMSFAEISSGFPESGGTYTFAKKVLSVRAAFAAGWVVWFAYIVAGVLYALGFASYLSLMLESVANALGWHAPAWLGSRGFSLSIASLATGGYALSLVRQEAGGGQVATVGKVLVFAVLIVVGIVAVVLAPWSDTRAKLDPFMAGGWSGIVSAMGFTFIALQGFDLVAAIAGEVKEPARTIPRAMFLSLGLALVIYLPLLMLVSTVGTPSGHRIAELVAAQPDTIVAAAALEYMGPIGYWLVIVAAILSTLSALNANLMAASHVAVSMASDRTLPSVLRDRHRTRGTPIMAIYASALTLVAILFMVPDLAAAGAAASLIFLVSFALAHLTAYLARSRAGIRPGAYRTPWFPAVPLVGGLACAVLAGFQAITVPAAGAIVLIWLGLGSLLYFAIFRSPAEVADASAEAHDPELIQLRGRSPLVLLPVANPASAQAMVAVANALAPRRFGRVLLLSIVPVGPDEGADLGARLANAQGVVSRALDSSYAAGFTPEALITAAEEPWDEIQRVAEEFGCASLLLGINAAGDGEQLARIEQLMAGIECDVALMHAPAGWSLDRARRILVPIGGAGEQHELRARLLGSLNRTSGLHGARSVTFVRVVPTSTSDGDRALAQRALERLAEVHWHGEVHAVVERSDDAATSILEHARDFDLIVLGLRHLGGLRTVGDVRALSDLRGLGRRSRVVGEFAARIARDAPCATIMVSRKLNSTPW